MRSISISRQSADSSIPGAHLLTLTIHTGNDITTTLFVKQRIIKPGNTADDTFVAVASPTQLEDLPVGAPLTGNTGFFLDSTITLVSSDPAILEEIWNGVLDDIQLLTSQLDDLDSLSSSVTYTVNSLGSSIDSSPA
jgi:hypothetical protein